MKTVVFWLAMVTMATACFAEDNGVKGGTWSAAMHSDTVVGSDEDTICFVTSMEATTFFGLSILLDSTTNANDSLTAKFRTLRTTADRFRNQGTPFTPILWQTGEFPTDTSRWITAFRENSLWQATNISPYLGELLQIIVEAKDDADQIPYVIELQTTDGSGF